MLTVIILILGVIIVGFTIALNKDNKELKGEPLEDRFSIVINELNKNILSGEGKIYTIDKRAFNLYSNTNQIIQFFYSTGTLNITWRYKDFGEEIVFKKDFHNLRDITPEKQKQIVNTFMNGLDAVRYENDLIDLETEVNVPDTDNVKLIIASALYNFCYSAKYASLFLGGSVQSPEIANHIHSGKLLGKESFLVLLFREFLKSAYNIDLKPELFNTYDYDDFTIYLDVERIILDNEYSYLEILMNDLEDVSDSEGEPLVYISSFVIHVDNLKGRSLYTVVFDPYQQIYAIRKVSIDGKSASIGFIPDDNNETVSEYLIEYINRQV